MRWKMFLSDEYVRIWKELIVDIWRQYPELAFRHWVETWKLSLRIAGNTVWIVNKVLQYDVQSSILGYTAVKNDCRPTFQRCVLNPWLIPDDGGSTRLWNVGRQSFYTAVYPRRQLWTSYSTPWELEISQGSPGCKSVTLPLHQPLTRSCINIINGLFGTLSEGGEAVCEAGSLRLVACSRHICRAVDVLSSMYFFPRDIYLQTSRKQSFYHSPVIN
jgi:hypothetical protein